MILNWYLPSTIVLSSSPGWQDEGSLELEMRILTCIVVFSCWLCEELIICFGKGRGLRGGKKKERDAFSIC